jgi:hypothetical protein
MFLRRCLCLRSARHGFVSGNFKIQENAVYRYSGSFGQAVSKLWGRGHPACAPFIFLTAAAEESGATAESDATSVLLWAWA